MDLGISINNSVRNSMNGIMKVLTRNVGITDYRGLNIFVMFSLWESVQDIIPITGNGIKLQFE